MQALVAAFEQARATRARTAKVAALSAAFAHVATRDGDRGLAVAARLATGRLLPVKDPRALGVGHALAFDAAVGTGRVDDPTLSRLARERRDLGEAIGVAFGALEGAQQLAEAVPSSRGPSGAHVDAADLALGDVADLAEALAGTPGRLDKLAALTAALGRASAGAAAYLVKAMLGELRIGVQEGLVLEALASAFGRASADTKRAAALVTDAGDVALLARHDALASARLELGRPAAFMLASPLETLTEPLDRAAYVAEDKVDGIRAQVHVDGVDVRIFGRGLEDVTVASPTSARSSRTPSPAPTSCSTARSSCSGPTAARARSRRCNRACESSRRPRTSSKSARPRSCSSTSCSTTPPCSSCPRRRGARASKRSSGRARTRGSGSCRGCPSTPRCP